MQMVKKRLEATTMFMLTYSVTSPIMKDKSKKTKTSTNWKKSFIVRVT